jgi:delta-aminolevulinic acid dehydratase/porphobilinogen synthase
VHTVAKREEPAEVEEQAEEQTEDAVEEEEVKVVAEAAAEGAEAEDGDALASKSTLLDKVRAIRRQFNLPRNGDMPLLTGLAEAEECFYGPAQGTATSAMARADALMAQIGLL